jgi:hypothetical protein
MLSSTLVSEAAVTLLGFRTASVYTNGSSSSALGFEAKPLPHSKVQLNKE